MIDNKEMSYNEKLDAIKQLADNNFEQKDESVNHSGIGIIDAESEIYNHFIGLHLEKYGK